MPGSKDAKVAARKLILLTNDDGIDSPGLAILRERLSEVGEVFVVAPDRQRSAAGHSFTAFDPVPVKRVDGHSVAVGGTPTDCVLFAVKRILGRKPDLVVSGIKCGANLGDDVTYSGTVAAALEGTLHGIPAFSISLAAREGCRFEQAAGFAVHLASVMLENELPPGVWLNVNVPAVERIEGVRVTRQGRRIYHDEIVETEDAEGKVFYRLGGSEPGGVPEGETDLDAIRQNMISVTPLRIDLPSHAHLDLFRGWRLDHR